MYKKERIVFEEAWSAEPQGSYVAAASRAGLACAARVAQLWRSKSAWNSVAAPELLWFEVAPSASGAVFRSRFPGVAWRGAGLRASWRGYRGRGGYRGSGRQLPNAPCVGCWSAIPPAGGIPNLRSMDVASFATQTRPSPPAPTTDRPRRAVTKQALPPAGCTTLGAQKRGHRDDSGN
ncbi:hypothetical protein Purlil1_9072 [Purpureocillium lilacinum]|uniref:Uncharacterized protein n=1 Tax=Purpureocillium lilacinum TaxID=33203 RepID=A0ABR0BS46_PURLI|nr:hypothetical protein Purlil1_9072 [Purpureocillium lilacinum]